MITNPPINAGKVADTYREDSAGSVASTGWRKVRRCVVFVVGGTLLLLGIALLVLPGPAFIMIPAGLAVLAVEFRWARRWLRKARSILPQIHGGKAGRHPQSQPPQTLQDQPNLNSTGRSTIHNRPQN